MSEPDRKTRFSQTPDLLNPTGTRQPDESVSYINRSVKVPNTPEWLQLLETLHRLARQENASDSHIYRAAFIEYAQEHDPGNPVPVLENYLPGGPSFSRAAQKKLARRPDVEVLPPGVNILPCEECHGSGKGPAGDDCHHCAGYGTIQCQRAF